jgi:hypothetical protein
MPSLSEAPSCPLPDVLKFSGERARELVVHLQSFIAHEQVRYDQTDRPGIDGSAGVTGAANQFTPVSQTASLISELNPRR